MAKTLRWREKSVMEKGKKYEFCVCIERKTKMVIESSRLWVTDAMESGKKKR